MYREGWIKEVGGGGGAGEREPDKWLVGGEERLKGSVFLREYW